MITLLIFILILGVVVIGHELGHFMVARWCGVRVEEFGFGIPPKIAGFRPKNSETEYSLNSLPIGGFVRLYGEDGDHQDSPRSFASKKPWQKIAILVAGVGMNLLIAWVAFTIVGLMGSLVAIPEESVSEFPDSKTIIATIAPDSPAQEVGLRFGDTIVSVNGQEVQTPSEIQTFISENLGKELTLTIQRGQEVEEIQVLARSEAPEGQGAIGIAMQLTTIERLGLFPAMRDAVLRIYSVITMTLEVLGQLIVSWIMPGVAVPAEADVRGPIGMVSAVGEFRQLGLVYIVTFVGLISTSLALFNILPIPALDGGRVVFVVIEWLKGSPVKAEWETAVHTIGFLVVIGLTILVTIRDLINLF